MIKEGNEQMKISVCMITKNEEKHLPDTLEAIKDMGFEIVIADTGSTDRTKEIAAKYTDKVFDFTWIDDFSAARNFSISKTTNDWILVLDADEIVIEADMDKLCKLTSYPEQILASITRKNHYENNGQPSIYTDKPERFFNKRAFHFEGSIHEQPRPLRTYPIPKEGISHETGIVVDHVGYALDARGLEEKKNRNVSMLLAELKKHPDDPYIYFQLGQAHNGFDDAEALKYYSKGLEFDVDPSLEYVQMMLIAYGYCLLHLEKYEEALSISGVYDEFATSADFFTLMGVIYMRTGNLIQAMGEFLKATMCPVFHVEGSNSFIPLYNMGCISEMLGEKEMALSYYQKCGDYAPALERISSM